VAGESPLVDPANPPFGWETDPSKKELALIDPAKPPLAWKYGTWDECVGTTLCGPILPESDFCKSIHSGVDYAQGIVSAISEKVNYASFG
jgi:hypothetical protein